MRILTNIYMLTKIYNYGVVSMHINREEIFGLPFDRNVKMWGVSIYNSGVVSMRILTKRTQESPPC